MLQMYVGDLLIVGYTRENVNRLVDRKPMFFRITKPVNAICLVFGETKPEIIAQVETEMEIDVPEALKAAAAADPT